MATKNPATPTQPYNTLKAAREAGFRERKDWEYGGEEITIKGRLLVRNPKEAHSQSQWSNLGFRVRKGAEPHCRRSVHLQVGGHVTYDVYREDQVEPKRKVSPKPPVRIDVLASVWVINRRAKRCRDQASAHYKRGLHGFAGNARKAKDRLYSLKGEALHHLLAEGRLKVVGYHRFPDGNWAELLQGDGYTFHRPCPPRAAAHVEERDQIEAKPRGAKEPRLKDAVHTVEMYLESKPEVQPYQWPAKSPASKKQWPGDLEEVDSDEYGGDEYEDEDHDVEW